MVVLPPVPKGAARIHVVRGEGRDVAALMGEESVSLPCRHPSLGMDIGVSLSGGG